MAEETKATPESKPEPEVQPEPKVQPEPFGGVVVKPDLQFVDDIIAAGGESLKKCYQCATCSVVCNLAPDNKPFPRKEMIYAQWGLKDKLFPNPDIWLCHQCSDCTAQCPRGAKPGEVLNAVRKMSIENYSVPRFLGKIVGRPGGLGLLVAIPVVILLVILGALGHLNPLNIPRGEHGELAYSTFLPSIYIDATYVPAFMFAVVILAIGVYRYWKDMLRAAGLEGKVPNGSIVSAVIETIKDILWHTRFEKCELTKLRKISHFLVFYSFIGLAITTAWAVSYLYGPPLMKLFGLEPFSWMLGESPYPLTDPVKWVGNASAIGLIFGINLVVRYRLQNKEKAGQGGYYDWLLISVIYIIAVSGILAELLRIADIPIVAFPTYFIHLVAVFFLFAYAPYSKMAHMVYRATAMTFDKYTENEK
jgi:quinone-modifying oxidoreductase subunit QmoC